MILYPKFYKATGVRLPKQLKNPILNNLMNIELPKNSYFHFTDQDPETLTIGINEDNIFLSNLEKASKVVIFHQTDYSPSIDLKNFRVTRDTIQKQMVIKDYHRKHPNFAKGFVDTSKVGIITNLIVKNHTLVGAEYGYVKTVLSEYDRLRNYWKSVFEDIVKTQMNDNRHHFVAIKLPRLIPSRSQLNKWETESKEVNWKKFNSEERYLFTEFYSWLKEDSNSIIPQDAKALERVNVIFYFGINYFVINLGLLKSWIIPEIGKTDDKQELLIADARKWFLLGTMKAVMGEFSEPEAELDDENTNDISSQDDENNAEDNDDFSADTDTSDLGSSSLDQRQQLFNQKKENYRNINARTIGTVEELLKIGSDRNVSLDAVKAGNEENIFNTEIADQEDDEENLALLESMNSEDEIEIEKIEILKQVGYKPYKSEQIDLTTAINKKVDKLSTSGQYTATELRRFKTLGAKWEAIKDPYGSNKLAPEIIDINPADLVMPEENKLVSKSKSVLDQSMLNCSLDLMTRKYTEEVLPRHMMAIGINLQKNGICVTDYKVTKVENAFDAYEVHSFKLIPLEGQESTIKVKVPIVDEDGNFVAGGVKSRLRNQRMDLPIRKINHREVALTSYVSKFFVSRSEFSAYSQERWLEKQLIALSNDRSDVIVNFADVYKNYVKAPLKFTILSRLVSKIEIGDYEFNFDVERMNQLYGADLVKTMSTSKKNQIVVGKSKKSNAIIIMAEDGTLFEASTENLEDIKNIGTIETILGFPVSKMPVDMAEISLFGEPLPLVFVLGYFIGLGNLLETVKAKVTRHPKGTRLTLDDQEYAIRFNDETLVFDRNDYRSMLLFGGLKKIQDEIKQYSVYQFDDKDVYGSVLLDLKVSARYLKGLETYRDLWVDPITENVLVEMGEPTDFIDLLFSALDKLVIDQHIQTRDEAGFRLRGYERFAGLAYAEMVKAVKTHNNKPSKANSKVELNPQAAWMTILQDQSTTPSEDSNPIHSLKEQEIVVYRGAGGRDGRTLNSESRKYHENSIGIISDATVDNGDAGTVMYLTADPNFKSVLGLPKIVDEKERKNIPPTKLLATSSLIAPGIEFDDPKRRNFASIQNSRTTSCVGMTLLPVRTGYEAIIPYRVSKLYAFVAREEGVVKEITKNVVVIKYKTGKEERLPLGRRSGKWQGKIVPHELITDLKVGDKFKEGTPITYNPSFFQYNWVSGELAYKQGLLARVAFIENSGTYEDSSEMSTKFTAGLATSIIEERTILVHFNQEVEDLVKVGQEVEYETTLCRLLDTLSTASSDRLFTADSRTILSDLSSITPSAEAKGKVVAIEAIYAGDPDDMTESLRAIVDKADREKSNAAKEQGKPRQDGSVDPGFRVNGVIMEPNSCIIRVAIETSQAMRTGSKVVLGLQMKSVVGRTWDEPMLTESGQEIDMTFGYQSVQNRVLLSPEKLGSTNNLMVAGSLSVAKVFRGNKK